MNRYDVLIQVKVGKRKVFLSIDDIEVETEVEAEIFAKSYVKEKIKIKVINVEKK